MVVVGQLEFVERRHGDKRTDELGENIFVDDVYLTNLRFGKISQMDCIVGRQPTTKHISFFFESVLFSLDSYVPLSNENNY